MRGTTRKAWIAAALNFFLFPLVYFYLGAWRIGLSIVVSILILALLTFNYTVLHPPGLYGVSRGARLLGQLIIGLVFSIHTFCLVKRGVPARPLRWRIASTALAIAGFVVVVAIFRAFWPVSVYDVKSAAMQPTLVKGDILAFHGARALCGQVHPNPGDVVVFKRMGLPLRYLDRVIAGPGDTVSFAGPTPVVDGRPATERPIDKADAKDPGDLAFVASQETLQDGASYRVQHVPDANQYGTSMLKLKPNEWYVLGDNRDDALDSRRYGPILGSAICSIGFEFLQSRSHSLGTKP